MRKAAQFLTLSFAMVTLATDAAQGEIAWQTNLRTAHAQAQAEGKLLLLHFYSDNCTWCEKLEEGSFKAPQVNQAIGQNFVPVKIHANSSPKLTEMFQVTKFPTDVIVTTEGRTLAHAVSPQNPDRYVAMLQSTLPSLAQQPGVAPGVDSSAAEQIAAVPPAASSTIEAPQVTMPQQAANDPAGSLTLPSFAQTDAQLAASRQASPSFEMPSLDAPQTSVPPMGQHPAQAIESPVDLTAGLSTGGIDVPTGSLAMPVNAPQASGEAMGGGDDLLIIPSYPPTGIDDTLVLGEAADLPSATAGEASVDTPGNAADLPIEQPELAMQGYCAVTVINENKWVEGSPQFGVIHLGKLYLFTSEGKMNTFLADPMPYTPVLNEIDVVRFFEERKIVPGKREWGLKDPVYNRMFFFADEAAMNHFYNEYERYTDAAIEVMDKAVNDANPGN
jgi:thioredoxin-related protein